MLTRQMTLIDKRDQEKFKNSTIAVIGCGGIGGMTIEMLARLGVGKLILVDEDVFDVSNLNRQVLSTQETLNEKKSKAAAKRVKSINPEIDVEYYTEHVNPANIDKLIENSSIVMDALDNVLTRVIVSRKAREHKIPFVHGAVEATQGQVTTFLPNTKSYEKMFNLPSCGKDLTEEVMESLKNVTSHTPPVFGPTPNLVSCMQAMEAYKIITGLGKVTVSPKLLTFDLLDLNSFNLIEI